MERKLLFNLSDLTDAELIAAQTRLLQLQAAGWRVYDVADGFEPDGRHVGIIRITDGDFERRLIFALSPPTEVEFAALLQQLRSLQSAGWAVVGCSRAVESGAPVGAVHIRWAAPAPTPRRARDRATEPPAPGETLRILCVHGVGHAEADPLSETQWRAAIVAGLKAANSMRPAQIEFVAYDELFAAKRISAADVAQAMLKLAASGLVHGVGDLVSSWFGRRRGLADLSDTLRWTAGMVVQWTEDDQLRADLRRRMIRHMQFEPDMVLAHSLGSLIAYDTFSRPENRGLLAGRLFVSFGSQIGNPFVRSSVALNGRIQALEAALHWYHLFNRHDDAFTASIRIHARNFTQTSTHFDDPGFLDHDATRYLTHPNTVSSVWLRAAEPARQAARAFTSDPRQVRVMTQAFSILKAKPKRRALLVGINDYPDPANRLEGCVNDVFLMSSVLQECGFDAEDIRVVLDARATSSGVLERLEWLLDGTQDGQDRVFYYSGHGAKIPGYGVGEVVDRDDECLVTHDFDWKREHAITDDQFYDLYTQLPYQTSFLTIFDCCHSGGLARDGALRARGINPPDDIRHRLLRWNVKERMWETRPVEEAAPDLKAPKRAEFFGESGITHRLGCASELRTKMTKNFDQACAKLGHKGPFMPVILKACQEEEYAYEYRHGVISHGAFTYALAQTFRDKRGRGLTWNQLVAQVAATLARLNYAQRPAVEGPSKVLAKKIPWTASRPASKTRRRRQKN